MKEKLTIDGKEYTLTANRRVYSEYMKNAKVDKDGHVDITMPDIDKMFFILLKSEMPNITEQEASKLFDKAEEEYEISDLVNAIQEMTNKVFTQASNGKKKIEWLGSK